MKEKKTVVAENVVAENAVAENAVAENAVETTEPTNPKTDIVNNADLEKLQKAWLEIVPISELLLNGHTQIDVQGRQKAVPETVPEGEKP